jgi:5-formyltetrahydrofolate cyclo-ligase
MKDTKSEWRRLLLGARRTLSDGLRRRYSAAVVERLRSLPEFAGSRAVLLYTATGAEVDIRPLAALAAAAGKAIYYPADGEGRPGWLAHAPIPPPSAAVSPADSGAVRTTPERPALVVVPGVGFDRHGIRLGRGRGFYDRALAALRECGPVFAVGASFEVQIVAELPRDSWDQPVDLVATERQLIVPEPCVGSPRTRLPASEVHEP